MTDQTDDDILRRVVKALGWEFLTPDLPSIERASPLPKVAQDACGNVVLHYGGTHHIWNPIWSYSDARGLVERFRLGYLIYSETRFPDFVRALFDTTRRTGELKEWPCPVFYSAEDVCTMLLATPRQITLAWLIAMERGRCPVDTPFIDAARAGLPEPLTALEKALKRIRELEEQMELMEYREGL